MKASGPRIEVTVVYALPDRAIEIVVQLPAGATVGDAIEGSGLVSRQREVDFTGSRVGIFGKRVIANPYWLTGTGSKSIERCSPTQKRVV